MYALSKRGVPSLTLYNTCRGSADQFGGHIKSEHVHHSVFGSTVHMCALSCAGSDQTSYLPLSYCRTWNPASINLYEPHSAPRPLGFRCHCTSRAIPQNCSSMTIAPSHDQLGSRGMLGCPSSPLPEKSSQVRPPACSILHQHCNPCLHPVCAMWGGCLIPAYPPLHSSAQSRDRCGIGDSRHRRCPATASRPSSH